MINNIDKYGLKAYILDKEKQPYDVNGILHKNQNLVKKLNLDDI